MFPQQRFDLLRKAREPLGQRRGGVGVYLAIGNVAEAVAVRADQPPSGGAEPRIEAEDDQARRSSSSSGTS
jgi:hypothetical protein